MAESMTTRQAHAGSPVPVAIGVMARAPVAGACKTRLIPAIGADGAAQLQRELITRTLASACDANLGAVTLFVTGEDPAAFWPDCERQYGVQVSNQHGADLGARMAHALSQLLASAQSALLIGTDCPALNISQLQLAASALRQARMVFMPAEDGGYVLVGARSPEPAAFLDMPWGTERVMALTRQRLHEHGWRPGREWIELPPAWDLDRADDLHRAAAAGLIDARWRQASVRTSRR